MPEATTYVPDGPEEEGPEDEADEVQAASRPAASRPEHAAVRTGRRLTFCHRMILTIGRRGRKRLSPRCVILGGRLADPGPTLGKPGVYLVSACEARSMMALRSSRLPER